MKSKALIDRRRAAGNIGLSDCLLHLRRIRIGGGTRRSILIERRIRHVCCLLQPLKASASRSTSIEQKTCKYVSPIPVHNHKRTNMVYEPRNIVWQAPRLCSSIAVQSKHVMPSANLCICIFHLSELHLRGKPLEPIEQELSELARYPHRKLSIFQSYSSDMMS